MKIRFENTATARYARISEDDTLKGYDMSVKMADGQTDLTGLQWAAAEAKRNAARELRRAERIELAIKVLQSCSTT